MTARTVEEKVDIWAALAGPLPADEIQWRQDGKPSSRDGKVYARFVGFIDAQCVQARFDSVVPGEWDLTLELLPAAVTSDGEEVEPFSFKARIQVLGVIREDVGSGKDYKTASTDAFKRAAVRFGVGRELYALHPNWVQMDGDGKYAKPLEDPAVVYARRYGRPNGSSTSGANGAGVKSAKTVGDAGHGEPAVGPSASQEGAPASAPDANGPLASDELSCPKCGGRMWDNRLTKRNPKAPDYKCRDRGCDGVVWPPKGTTPETGTSTRKESTIADDTEIPF